MLNIAVQRLNNQKLVGSACKRPADLVLWMGALQAQDYAGAKWSIGLRVSGSTDADVQQAIVDRKILRTWAMRGTLHFVAAKDIGWMLALLAPGIIAGNARRYKELDLDERTMVRSNAVVAKALQGKQLDRPALVAVLEKNGIVTAGQRTPYLLQRAVMDRIMCQGIMRGNSPTFMLLDKPMLRNRFPDPEGAAAELALRYFTSRGPASLQDFIWWSGLSSKAATAAVDAIKQKLSLATIGERTYWFTGSLSALKKIPTTAYLLPGFDEYLLSYKDRSSSTDIKRIRKLTPPNGMLPPTIVINGKVVGIWKRTFKRGRVIINCKPFAKMSDEEENALSDAANRYGEFLEMAVETG